MSRVMLTALVISVNWLLFMRVLSTVLIRTCRPPFKLVRTAGTSFDGGGVGNNQPDTDVWHVYSAVRNHGTATTPQQVLSQTILFG